jgi:hypothetical protein
MAKQTINQGTAPTGAGGDTFRSGSAKLQANDDEIYAQLGATAQGVLPAALPVSKGGTGGATAAAARENLGLGGVSTDNVVPISRGGHNGTTKETAANNLGLKVSQYNGAFTSVATLGTNNLNNLIVPGYYKINLAVSELANSPPLRHASGLFNGLLHVIADSTMTAVHQVFYNSYYSIDSYYLRFRYSASQWSPWVEIKHSANTTIDSNGFVKNASPIVKLFLDKVELNEEAQLQEITFEKLGIGDYLIKDSSGFSQEGWYVETPKDANGNVLFSVIYTTLENGDISVKTYKKKFDLETASIIADLDNPVDITENRWIDLRLQELPQPEIEVTDDSEQ